MPENTSLFDGQLRTSSSVVGRTLRDTSLPGRVLVVAIRREGETIFASASTRLEAGDVLTIVADPDSLQLVLQELLALAALAVVLSGCTSLPQAALPPETPIPPTAVPAPTDVPPPTAVPAQTDVPSPTDAPAQTAVPSPTSSPKAWTPPPRTKTEGCLSQGGLPDPACTPGAVDPRVDQTNITTTICRAGYTRTVRPPVSVTDRIKRDQVAAYGLVGVRLADEELDHLISLELGGAPQDVANLWPEAWNGDNNAHQKDAVENFLHEQVCRGLMQLADAQQQIATDWRTVFASRRLQPAPATPTD